MNFACPYDITLTLDLLSWHFALLACLAVHLTYLSMAIFTIYQIVWYYHIEIDKIPNCNF